jgi:hypothetical protein
MKSAAANFTGQTLAWFQEGEDLENHAREVAAKKDAEARTRKGRLRLAIGLTLLAAALAAIAVIVAYQLGYVPDLPDLPDGWQWPWQ